MAYLPWSPGLRGSCFLQGTRNSTSASSQGGEDTLRLTGRLQGSQERGNPALTLMAHRELSGSLRQGGVALGPDAAFSKPQQAVSAPHVPWNGGDWLVLESLLAET